MSKVVQMTVDGMQCGMCEAHVKDTIRSKFPEAKKMTANHTTGECSFVLEHEMPLPMLKHEMKAGLDPQGYKLLDIQEVDAPEKRGLFGFGKKK